MKTEQLLLSSLDITEDEYIFKGQFILSGKGKSKQVDMEQLDQQAYLEELKEYFDLEEPTSEIRNKLISMVVEKLRSALKSLMARTTENPEKCKNLQ